MRLLLKLVAASGSLILANSPGFAEVITFENLSPGVQAEGPITYPGVTFSSSSGAFSINPGTTGQSLCAYQFDCSATLTIDFLKPASNLSFTYSNDDAASILLFQGESETASFRGRLFADGNPLTQDIFNLSIVPNITQLVLFSTDPGGVTFDNFSFTTSATAAVPEPATWAMTIVGFGAIGGALRRRIKIATRVRFA